MNVLMMGLPFGAGSEPLEHFQSASGHSVRTLGAKGESDYAFSAEQTVAEIIGGIGGDWKPDCLVCWCPEVLPPPRRLEESPVKTVAVVSDWTVYSPQLEENLARYDVVVTDRLGSETFRCPGVTPHFVGPLYSHRTGVHRPLSVERDIDIAFAGNLNHAMHIQRGRMLEIVASLSDRYHVVIASELPVDEYTALLSRSRVAFNFCLRGEMNLRCFEALACGAALFVEEDNREAHALLEDREHAVFYREENLAALLEEYLEQPEALTRIAANGFSLSARIAGEKRLDGILDAVAGLEESGRPFRDFPEERKALAEVMQYASSRNPTQRRYADRVCAEGRKAFPESIGLKVSEGCGILGSLSSTNGEEAGEQAEALLHTFRDAATGAPEAAVLWLNLALLCRHGNAAVAERRFLELALEAPSTAYGGLLVGMNQDPYYGRWRAALAFGRANVELLWAAAAARLARLHLEAGELVAARAFAERSIGYCSDVVVPHQVLAKVCQEEGDLGRAAEILEQSLPLTALDSEHRLALIEVLRGLGRLEEARALAAASERIFRAWLRAAHVAERFGTLRATLE